MCLSILKGNTETTEDACLMEKCRHLLWFYIDNEFFIRWGVKIPCRH